MLRPRPPSYVWNAHLCTDIILDINHKYSIIGAFANDIVVNQFPARLKLALYIEFNFPRNGETELDMRFMIDDIQALSLNVQIDVIDKSQMAPFTFPGFDLSIDAPALLRVDIGMKGKWSPLMRKEIKQGAVNEPVIFRSPTDAALRNSP